MEGHLEASGDQAERERLDIAWIADPQLDGRVRESIDASYSDEKHRKRQKQQVDARLKKHDKDSAAKLDALRDEIATEKALARNRRSRRYSKKDLAEIENDPRFLDRKAELSKQREVSTAQARDGYRSSVDTTRVNQSVANPDSPKVALDEGKMRSRTNFMSWATYLMGDTAKIKQHFRSIRGAAGDPHMLLADNAASRFEAAKAQRLREERRDAHVAGGSEDPAADRSQDEPADEPAEGRVQRQGRRDAGAPRVRARIELR